MQYFQTEVDKIEAAYQTDLKMISDEGAKRWRQESLKESTAEWAKKFQPGMIVQCNHQGETINGIIDYTSYKGCVSHSAIEFCGRWTVRVIWFKRAKREFGSTSEYDVTCLDITDKTWDKYNPVAQS